MPRLPLAGLLLCGLSWPLARPLCAAEHADFVIDAAHPGAAVSPTAAPLAVHVAMVGRDFSPRSDLPLGPYSDTVAVFNLR